VYIEKSRECKRVFKEKPIFFFGIITRPEEPFEKNKYKPKKRAPLFRGTDMPSGQEEFAKTIFVIMMYITGDYHQ
jgi:hypothetical protein